VKGWEGDIGDTFPLSHLLTFSLSHDKKEPFYGRVEYNNQCDGYGVVAPCVELIAGTDLRKPALLEICENKTARNSKISLAKPARTE
jgi:hypothetical protein